LGGEMRVAVAMLPEVRELLREDPSQLSDLLDEIHDEDLADLLKLLEDDEAILLLELLDVEEAADIFERLDEDEQTDLVEQFGPERLAPIVSEMAPDDRTDLVDALPDEIGDELLEEMDPEAAAEVEVLIAFGDDTAGGLMTTDLVKLRPELTANEVITALRSQSEEAETIYYIYAVEDDETLAGVASLRDLIVADGETKLREIMSEHVHSVRPEVDQEEVAFTLRKYDLVAVPVVDEQHRLLGLITVDDVMDIVEEEQDEDVQRLGAVAPIENDYFKTSFWTFISKRAPWLLVLFFGQFITEAILRRYDAMISVVTTLTFYLPLLVSTGGNSGAQSATLIIRSIATGDVEVRDWKRILIRELGQGLILGGLLAVIGMLRVWMVGDGVGMAVTVGITVISIVVMGCTVGATLPLLLRRVGLDPATSSTPFVATIVDVLGIVLYLAIANVILAGALAQSGVSP
jgi:magnesium transporter